jgi:outer membrane murein-binding lipoprotein Lpp
MNRRIPAIIVLGLLGQIVFAQGTDTQAKATDWEEINFEFNQAVIVDGFPGLLRLADLLRQHSDYKVTLVGNADQIGGNRINDQLSLKRANAVAQFLQHYGAGASQIRVRADGKKNPEVNAQNANARFMNRRVVITVVGPDGTAIGDGSLTGAINDFEKFTRNQLGKIDNILSQLHDLEEQVKALQGDAGVIRSDTGALKQDTAQLKQDTGAIHTDTQELVRRPAPLSAEQTTEIAHVEAQKAADYALAQEAMRNRKYALLGFDAGPTFGGGRTGVYSADVFGSALIPFANGETPGPSGIHALQVDGDWDYSHKRTSRPDGLTDGIFDIGLVNRFGPIQMGTFAQFDYASLNAYQGGALLGSGIVTLDYVFRGGSVGVFGAKGFREYANIGTTSLTGGQTPAYLRYEDQIGFHTTGSLGRHVFLENSLAFKKSYNSGLSKLPSAFLRFSFPLNDQISLFVQADENNTLQNVTNGERVVFGIQFGNWLRPGRYGQEQGVIPVSVPHTHYQLLAR